MYNSQAPVVTPTSLEATVDLDGVKCCKILCPFCQKRFFFIRLTITTLLAICVVTVNAGIIVHLA